MNQQPKCEHCGKSVGADAPSGLCPSCLMQAGLLSEDPTVPPNPTEYYQVDASAIPPADLAPLFPNLKLVRLLGQGGMGAVYQARQVKLDRDVALKIIRPDAQGKPALSPNLITLTLSVFTTSDPSTSRPAPSILMNCFTC